MDEIIGIQAVRAALRDTPALARTLYLMKGRRDARYNELIGMAREAGLSKARIKACCSSVISARWRTSKSFSPVGQSSALPP
jgi:hypothetical protein